MTTANIEDLPREPASLLRGQKHDDIRHIFRLAHAPKRNFPQARFLLMQMQATTRLNWPRRNNIDRNAIASPILIAAEQL